MEIIVHNKEDFNKLREYATYSSELTGVLELSGSGLTYVLENLKDIVDKYIDVENIPLVDERPELVLINKKLFIQNIDEELSIYLGLPYNKEVKSTSYYKVMELLINNSIKMSEEVKALFTDLTEDDALSKLQCSKFNINHKHKRWSLRSLGEDKKIKDLHFENRTIETKSYKVYKGIVVDRVEGTTVYGHNNFGEVELRFFFLSFNQKALFNTGAVINAMTDKPYGGKGKKILINPEIVPYSFPNTFIRKELKSNKRDIPIKLLRLAFIEFTFRNR